MMKRPMYIRLYRHQRAHLTRLAPPMGNYVRRTALGEPVRFPSSPSWGTITAFAVVATVAIKPRMVLQHTRRGVRMKTLHAPKTRKITLASGSVGAERKS